MPMTIFDLVKSQELTSYWETLTQDRAPYFGETLFPSQQKLGLSLDWLKGANGLPVVLKPSAFDSKAIPRARLGFEKLTAQMPFFKESSYVDEELRQQLNMVLESGNQSYIDAVINRVFDDETALLEGAAARREQMRMMLLTTGTISISANGQNYFYDYGIPEDNKVDATTGWSNPDADIIGDIRTWQDQVEDATGVRPTRAVCSRKTWNYFLNNTAIKNGVLGNDSGAPITEGQAKQHLATMLDLEVYVYTKRYTNDEGVATTYVPDDTFVLFPTGNLGTGWFGTTPEQSDLMTSNVGNVSITDTGVAVSTIQLFDPVNVDTKVTMIYLPDFPTANQVVIADVAGE